MKNALLLCIKGQFVFTLLLLSSPQGRSQISPVWAAEWVSPVPVPESVSWPRSYIEDVAVTTDGRVAATGFQSYATEDASHSRAYFTMSDSTGSAIWAHYISGFSNSVSIDADEAGDVYITGDFSGWVDFTPAIQDDDFSLYSERNSVFLLKLNSSGVVQWLRSWENQGLSQSAPVAVRVSPEGDVMISGMYSGTIALSADPSITLSAPSSNSHSLFLARFSGNGDCLWHGTIISELPEGGWIAPSDMLFDTDGNLVLSGLSLFGSADFDPGAGEFEPTVNELDQFVFVLKLNPSGDMMWMRVIQGAPQGDHLWFRNMPLAMGDDGEIYMGAGLEFPLVLQVTFQSETLEDLVIDPAKENAFIFKLNGDGDLMWANPLELSPFMSGTGMPFFNDLDFHDGKLTLFTYTNGLLDADPSELTALLGDSDQWQYRSSIILWNSQGQLLSAIDLGFEVGAWNSGNVVFRADRRLVVASDMPVSSSAQESGVVNIHPDPGQVFEVDVSGLYPFLIEYEIDTCGLYVHMPEAIAENCDGDSGQLMLDISGGTVPYSLLLNDQTVDYTSPLSIPQSGWNELIIRDSRGCQRESVFFVDSPDFSSDVDWDIMANHGIMNPGFLVGFTLVASNNGCVNSPAQLSLTLPPGLTVSSCSHAFTSLNVPEGLQLIWQLDPMTFDDAPVVIDLQLIADVSLTVGAIVCFSAEVVSSIEDVLPENNVWHSCAVVMASYDPNDLTAFPEGKCEAHYADATEPITYRVRFQNTGTAPATFVHVHCPVDSSFDLASFAPLHSSHTMITELVDGELVFRFENIMLPDSTSNPDESQGYLFYQITPLPGVAEETVVWNQARIYFDYNAPIITNQTFHTLTYEDVDAIICEEVGINESEREHRLSAFPNPSSGLFSFDDWIKGCRIYNINGTLVFSSSIPLRTLDLRQFADGLYLLRDDNGRSVRLIKTGF